MLRQLFAVTFLFMLGSGIVWSNGYRLNTSTSYPPGLYQLQPKIIPKKGSLILFCPPDNSTLTLAKNRNYIKFGPCSGGFSPVIKRIFGQSGDRIVLGEYVSINSSPHPEMPVLKSDVQNRPLPQLAGFTVPDNHVFVLSDHQPVLSFDSRYYGPVPTANIIGVIQPVLVAK